MWKHLTQNVSEQLCKQEVEVSYLGAVFPNSGVGPFVEVSNHMKSLDYLALLNNVLLPFVQCLEQELHIMDLEYQDDNTMSIEVDSCQIGLQNMRETFCISFIRPVHLI